MSAPNLTIVPVTLAQARRFVAEHHSHNEPPQGHVFSVGVMVGDELVGVAIGGRPVARGLGHNAGEILRVCVKGNVPNACSMLYGAMRRALAAIGRTPVYSYTLAEESAACLRAAGFRRDADVPARDTWSSDGRPRVDVDLFGNERRPIGPKTRWVWP